MRQYTNILYFIFWVPYSKEEKKLLLPHVKISHFILLFIVYFYFLMVNSKMLFPMIFSNEMEFWLNTNLRAFWYELHTTHSHMHHGPDIFVLYLSRLQYKFNCFNILPVVMPKLPLIQSRNVFINKFTQSWTVACIY